MPLLESQGMHENLLSLIENIQQDLDKVSHEQSQKSPSALLEDFHDLRLSINEFFKKDELLRWMYQQAPIGVILVDQHLRIVEANALAYVFLEKPDLDYPQNATLKPISLTSYLCSQQTEFIDWIATNSVEPFNSCLKAIPNNLHVKIFQKPCRYADQDYLMLILIPEDKEFHLQRALEVYKLVYETSHQGIIILDKQFRIVRVNPAYTKITGYKPYQVINSNHSLLERNKKLNPDIRENILSALNKQGYWQGDIVDVKQSGEEFFESMHISRLPQSADETDNSYYIAIIDNVSTEVAEKKKLKALAEQDSMTGLLNRQGFNREFVAAFEHAQRIGESLTLIFFDLDKFKQLNDTWGHDYGDELLISFAKRLKHNLKQTDLVARLGGDEFVVILSGDLSEVALEALLNKLLRIISRPYHLLDITYSCSASVGVSSYPKDAMTPSELLKAADIAMYQAKNAGRNQYQIFDAQAGEREQVYIAKIREIETAIDNLEFELFYQAQVRMDDGSICGLEALVRWRKPNGEVLLPAEFMPLIENSEAMLVLGRLLIDLFFVQVNSWITQGIKLPVSINISAYQLTDQNTLQHIRTIAEKYPSVVPLVEIEITETTIFEIDPRINETLDALEDLGFALVLDDFGTGYSSIYSLKKFNFKKIKIDRLFIHDISLQDSKGLVILDAMISMIQGIGLPIIFEGVEELAQAEYLLEHNGVYAQGFYYCKPMPKKEINRHLHKLNVDVE